MSPNSQDLARVLADYSIGSEVGRGQYGVVWSGRHRQLGRDVAIKVLAGSATPTAEFKSRFRREAQLLARMDHPHVVTVYDYREEDDLRVLVMELLAGGTFAEHRSTGMSVETAIASTIATASGLRSTRTSTASCTATSSRFLAFCRYLPSLYPPEIRIAIVLDNFSPHRSTKKDQRVGDWAAENNVELAYVPFYASRLNRIEAQFQALRYFALDGTDHPITRRASPNDPPLNRLAEPQRPQPETT